MNFIYSSTKQEMRHAMNKVKEIIYDTKKKKLNFNRKFEYKIYCPCGKYLGNIPLNFDNDNIFSILHRFLTHINSYLCHSIDLEHLQLSERIFGLSRTIEDAKKYKKQLQKKIKEIDKYHLYKELEKNHVMIKQTKNI